jgi:hypothetical protein
MRLDASDINELKPVLKETVLVILAEIDGDRDRIGLLEPEAAASLGIPQHVLGDARRRGEINARKIGKQYVYSKKTLREWLDRPD